MTERTGASGHLGIPLVEYDARIRTFVPWYDEMLGEIERLVDALAPERPVVLDLGTGTGAAAERCLRVRPRARLVAIDSDPGMLDLARARLEAHGIRPDLRQASYLDAELPHADVVVASLSLHHVRDPGAKERLYVRCRAASAGRGGRMIVADPFLPGDDVLVERGMAAWRSHLEGHYPKGEAAGHLRAWADEDTYFPLRDELDRMSRAGFTPEVAWRRDLFAVLLCT